MDTIVSALVDPATGLTPSSIYGQIADLVPFIIVMVGVSLGIYFLRKLVKGAGKAKVRF